MQFDWQSLIRIISAHCFPTATDPLNAKRFCGPTSCSVSHCDLLLLHSGLLKTLFGKRRYWVLTGSSKAIIKSVILWQEWVLSHFKTASLGLPCRRGPLELILLPCNMFLLRKVEVDSYASFHKSCSGFENVILQCLILKSWGCELLAPCWPLHSQKSSSNLGTTWRRLTALKCTFCFLFPVSNPSDCPGTSGHVTDFWHVTGFLYAMTWYPF